MKTIANKTISKHLKGDAVEDTRFERCEFDNCSARSLTLRRVEFLDCRCWACHLHDPIFEDCVISGLRMTIGTGGGGRTHPLFIWGGVAKHLTLRGRIGSLIWNPPYKWLGGKGWNWDRRELDRLQRAYEEIDWALDLREAVFTSVPSLGFGPPGRLILRDPATQPLVTRERADSADWRALGFDLGVWSVVLDSFVKSPWPDEIVLVPAMGNRKTKREEDLAGLEMLREIGVAS
jgi:hypothetical protein